MRRADRLFQIVQHLRGRRLTTAAQLAGWLRVSERTVYRDIRDLSISGVPVEGAAGVGYRLKPGFDFPPIMLTMDEVEALVAGARMVETWGGTALGSHARSAIAKIALALPAARREEIERTRRAVVEDLLGRAAHLTASRRKSAASLERGIRGELAELGMPKAAFSVQVTAGAGEDALGPFGFDAVEFLISPNPGEPLKPLQKIASGGELARVMLAIRTILAAADQTPTVIFDEVDAGIGGSMGDVVGRKLLASSQGHQVLCVTHLPQIACYGDQHLMVEKRTSQSRTDTVLHILSPEDRRHDVARMLGPSRTTTALDHASELLESAQRLKKRLKPAKA